MEKHLLLDTGSEATWGDKGREGAYPKILIIGVTSIMDGPLLR